MDYFPFVYQVAGVIAAVIITGIGVVPFTDFLKGIFKLEGNAAKWLSIILAMVLGIAEAIVAGEITGDMLTIENIAGLVTLIWFVSQNFYKEHYQGGQ